VNLVIRADIPVMYRDRGDLYHLAMGPEPDDWAVGEQPTVSPAELRDGYRAHLEYVLGSLGPRVPTDISPAAGADVIRRRRTGR
jgi:hypothetical protein